MMLGVVVIAILLGLSSAVSNTEPPVMATQWNTSLGISNDPSWAIRNVGPETAAVLLRRYFTAKNYRSQLLTFNTTNGNILANITTGIPMNTVNINSLALSTNEDHQLVAHYDGSNHFCVSRGPSLDKVWCTEYVSSCLSFINQYTNCVFTMTDKYLFILNNNTLRAHVAVSGRELWKVTLPFTNVDATIAATNKQVVVAYNGAFAFHAATGDVMFNKTEGVFAYVQSVSNAFSFTNDGNIAFNAYYWAILVSPTGEMLRKHITNQGAFTEVTVNSVTSEIFATYSYNDNQFLLAFASNGTQKWKIMANVLFSNLYVDTPTNSVLYMEATGVFRTDAETGTLISYSQVPYTFGIFEPWISADRKSVLVGSMRISNNGYDHCSIMGFSLQTDDVVKS